MQVASRPVSYKGTAKRRQSMGWVRTWLGSPEPPAIEFVCLADAGCRAQTIRLAVRVGERLICTELIHKISGFSLITKAEGDWLALSSLLSALSLFTLIWELWATACQLFATTFCNTQKSWKASVSTRRMILTHRASCYRLMKLGKVGETGNDRHLQTHTLTVQTAEQTFIYFPSSLSFTSKLSCCLGRPRTGHGLHAFPAISTQVLTGQQLKQSCKPTSNRPTNSRLKGPQSRKSVLVSFLAAHSS